MQIVNSTYSDIDLIFEFYRKATEYMVSKKQVAWPAFERSMVEKEIEGMYQWKLILDEQVACIWATALEDKIIWGEEFPEASVYIHRIATNPDCRGHKLVSKIVNWAENYSKERNLHFVRLDTVGLNQGLINHYQNVGFDFIGTRTIENTSELPEHYSKGPVCLFQRKVNY